MAFKLGDVIVDRLQFGYTTVCFNSAYRGKY